MDKINWLDREQPFEGEEKEIERGIKIWIYYARVLALETILQSKQNGDTRKNFIRVLLLFLDLREKII